MRPKECAGLAAPFGVAVAVGVAVAAGRTLNPPVTNEKTPGVAVGGPPGTKMMAASAGSGTANRRAAAAVSVTAAAANNRRGGTMAADDKTGDKAGSRGVERRPGGGRGEGRMATAPRS